MRADELGETRAGLEGVVEDVFASLPRADQRNTGNFYLHGVMLGGGRMSRQPMSGRLGVDYQQLQQFVSTSLWEVEPVRPVLVCMVAQLIGPDAWTVGDKAATGFSDSRVPLRSGEAELISPG